MEPSFSPLNLALAIEFLGLLQNDAVDLELIEVQISAERLQILLRSLQAKKVVEITSRLEKDLLEAGAALRLSLLPYLPTEPSATADVTLETPLSLVSPNNQLDSNSTRELELPTLDEFPLLAELENFPTESSKLTLQTAKLLVWLVDSTIFTLPYDSIETSLMPTVEPIIHSQGQDFLPWQQQTLPIYRLSELLAADTLPQLNSSSTRSSLFSSQMRLILIIRQGQQLLALESAIERLVTQPELIIQPVDHPHSSCYGFSDWEDGSWVRVIDVERLLFTKLLCSRTLL